MADVNLDEIVDYRAEYSAHVKNCKITGDQMTGLCPFHKDREASFSVNLKTGQWKCFAEGESGNFVSFWAKLNGTDTNTAYKEILRKYGIESKKKGKGPLKPYTLEEYSRSKGIPVEFLKERFHLSTTMDGNGIKYMEEPYFRLDGTTAHQRRRYGSKVLKWGYGQKNAPLYGEWMIEKIREKGAVILVEGESDTQTLWYMGFPAMGVPGASNFRKDHTAILHGLTVFLHVEPDQGGQTFKRTVCKQLDETGFEGKVLTWSCGDAGAKDPSALMLSLGPEKAKEKIRALLKKSEQADIPVEAQGGELTKPPVDLKRPDDWSMNNNGIVYHDKKEGDIFVCRTPITLTKRLLSLEDGTEKIEIAYLRDGEWHFARYPRNVIFQAKNITVLSDLGCTVTSENAKKVVKFLGDLEAKNLNDIPKAKSTSSFGWQKDGSFIPGFQNDVVLDIEPSQQGMASAYCEEGTLDGWIQTMSPHRSRERFRFILASGFTAPLLRILKQRIFFVYNWGGSKGGKTAALKAALSAWGDPERLMVNFNATQVGLERMAALYSDLPLGIDERQLAGKNQGGLEKIVYMIASGTGKIRGAKAGGLQNTQSWRTVALATGEEPIATESSQTGVSTRVLELYGGPFENEAQAAAMHRDASRNFGHAGPEFVRRLVQIPDEDMLELYDTLLNRIQGENEYGSHLAGVAAVTMADVLIGRWFFGDADPEGGSVDMAQKILTAQKQYAVQDVNVNAVNLIMDWVQSNMAFFDGTQSRDENLYRQRYGFIEDGSVWAYQSLVDDLLKGHGFSPRKTYRYMVEQKILLTEEDGRFTVRRQEGRKRERFLRITLDEVQEPGTGESDELDDEDELPF